MIIRFLVVLLIGLLKLVRVLFLRQFFVLGGMLLLKKKVKVNGEFCIGFYTVVDSVDVVLYKYQPRNMERDGG